MKNSTEHESCGLNTVCDCKGQKYDFESMKKDIFIDKIQKIAENLLAEIEKHKLKQSN